VSVDRVKGTSRSAFLCILLFGDEVAPSVLALK
jgi:hypothetical protein